MSRLASPDAGSRGPPRRRRGRCPAATPDRPDDTALARDDLADPHPDRVLPGGRRSWSKSGHLDRMKASGHFAYTREIVLSDAVTAGPSGSWP